MHDPKPATTNETGPSRRARSAWLLLLLALAPAMGCRGFIGQDAATRRENGYAIILPGILGKQGWDTNLAAGLEDGLKGAKAPPAVEIYDWTSGPLLFGLNLGNKSGNRRRAEEIVAKIVAYQDRYPGRPVYLIGHSGGGTMVVRVLEAMPEGRRIERAILLAAGLDSAYDLRVAMRRTRSGIVAFASPLDVPISMPLAGIHGALHGELSLAAATVGFSPPAGLSAEERAWYEGMLDQRQYSVGMIGAGHPGGHFGWTSPAFTARYLSPLLRPAPRKAAPPKRVSRQGGSDPYFRQAEVPVPGYPGYRRQAAAAPPR